MHETHFQISAYCCCKFSIRWYKLCKPLNCAECNKTANLESTNRLFLWQFSSSVCFLFPRSAGCIYWIKSVHLDSRKLKSKLMIDKACQCCHTVAGTRHLAGRVYMHAGATEVAMWRQTVNTGGWNIWTVTVTWAVCRCSAFEGLGVCIRISWATWGRK
jgi:hypothetical protein